jgi:hypothetical protein
MVPPLVRSAPPHPRYRALRITLRQLLRAFGPPYRPNPAHNPRSPHFNPRKTPEPFDAASVYQGAVRADMRTWYGLGADGSIYRYFYDNAGGVHFSGTISPADVPNHIVQQLQR